MNERELVQRFLDGDPAAAAGIEGNAELRKEAVRQLRMDAALRALHDPELAIERRVRAIMADLRGAPAEQALRDMAGALRRGRRWRWPLALAATFAAALGLGLWSRAPERGPVHTGDTLVLRAGETGRYRMADGTTFDLDGPADLIVGRTLRLREGRLQVRAAKRPATDPLVVLSPHARGEILGTTFVLDAKPEGTRLDVREGRVLFIPHDGPERLILRGEFVLARTEARDPIHHPFASDSPWNTALGERAVYEPVTELNLAAGLHIETRTWAIPIYVAAAADPVRKLFFRSNGQLAGHVRIDPETPPFTGDNNTYLALVDERLETAWELSGPRRDPDGNYRAGDIGSAALGGTGWDTAAPSHSGASLLGGLIRRGELQRGLPHALALLVPARAINREDQPYEWPATRALSSWRRYGTNGALRLGTLLALPPEADLSALSGPARRVAEALRDYGAYIVGTFDGGQKDVVLLADRACEPEVTPELMAELGPLLIHLHRVANNTPASPGGGGIARRPAPPPLVHTKERAAP